MLADTASFAVFWDIENCGFPSKISPIDVINNIAGLRLNNEKLTIKQFGIYGEEKCFEKFKNFTIETDDGVIIPNSDRMPDINCNISIYKVLASDTDSKRKADQADKKILADMFLHVLDSKAENPDETVGIILITSDIDFQYSLEQLTKRDCNTILLHGRNTKKALLQSASFRVDWYALVRNLLGAKELNSPGHSMNKRVVIPRKNWDQELQLALEALLEDKLVINEKSLRASMKIDGREKDTLWEEVLKVSGINEKIQRAINDQQEMEHYDPASASWDKFSISEIKDLYSTLSSNRELKRNGKYPMAKFLQETLAKNSRRYPLGKILEFVQLSINLEWIQYYGRIATINPTILQSVPFDQISNDNCGANSRQVEIQSITLSTAKSALQHYFQKLFKSLPKYETRREGPDHMPTFQASVRVPLPEGKFRNEYFYATGKGSNKKEAEKLASQSACTKILQYLPDFRFPNDYVDD